MINKKNIRSVLVMLLLLSMLMPIVSAEPPPVAPTRYYGNITVNEEPAPIDTVIIAKINEDERGRFTTTIPGKYGNEDPFNPDQFNVTGDESTETGATVKFYMMFYGSEILAKENVTWVAGEAVKEMDLTFDPPPRVIAVSPGDGATDISIATTISATFNEPMNELSAQNAFSISPSVSGTFSWDGNKTIFSPGSALAYDTEYTVTISTSAQDSTGNGLTPDYSGSFTTESAPPAGGAPRAGGGGARPSSPTPSPTPTPTPVATLTPTPTPAAETPTATPIITPTPTPTPEAAAPVIPWYVILIAIVAAVIIVSVGYLVLRKKP